MISFLLFLLKATAISLSGVLAPGPMTAATLAAGTRSRHAGILIALGHAGIEFPLMIVIIAGAGQLFERESVRIGIGLAGGAFLLVMGVQLLMLARAAQDEAVPPDQRHPFVIGIVLTGANPYFLVWWATIGLGLLTHSLRAQGRAGLAVFYTGHILSDLVWYSFVAGAIAFGKEHLNDTLYRSLIILCAGALLFFGARFIREGWRRPRGA